MELSTIIIKHLFNFVFIQLAKHAPAVLVIPVFIPMYYSFESSLCVFYLKLNLKIPFHLSFTVSYGPFHNLWRFLACEIRWRNRERFWSFGSDFLFIKKLLSRLFIWMFILMLNIVKLLISVILIFLNLNVMIRIGIFFFILIWIRILFIQDWTFVFDCRDYFSEFFVVHAIFT